MNNIIKKLLILLSLLPAFVNAQLTEIDDYEVDTTLNKWATKFNFAIFDHIGSVDTINPRGHVNETVYYKWDILVNRFIDSVYNSGCTSCDTINSTIDNMENKRLKFNNAVAYVNAEDTTFAAIMAEDYLLRNPQFSEGYATKISSYLKSTFSDSYIMPDGSDNYYSLYSDRDSANWFGLIKYNDDYTGTPIYINQITKTGSTIKWHIGDSIYSNNTMPQGYTVGDDKYLLFTSNDGFNNATQYYLRSNNNIDGNVPNIFAPSLSRLYIDSDNFDGIFPNFNYKNLQYTRFGGNAFDSITSIKGILNPAINWLWFNDNNFRTADIDLILRESRQYYSNNPPTANLSLQLNNNSSPSGGDYNSDLLYLDSIYQSQGHTLTYSIDAGGVSNLTLQPYLTLPDTIYLLTNEDYTIYDDGIAAKAIKENVLNLEYQCDIGADDIFGYKFNESEADTGYYSFTAIAKEGDNNIDTLTSVIRLFTPKSTVNPKSILVVGNSLIAGSQIVDSLYTTIIGGDLTFYGTQNESPTFHEGRSGYRYLDYVTDWRINRGLLNPFWDGSAFNFTAYREDTVGSVSPFTFVVSQLGINSITTNDIDTAWIENTWLGYVQDWVDEVLSDGTDYVIISMPPKCENSGEGWFYKYGDSRDQDQYIRKMQYIWLRLNEIYSGGRYADNVYVSSNGVWIDRNNSYPKSNGLHIDGVHPNADGYNQITKPLTALIEYLLKYK